MFDERLGGLGLSATLIGQLAFLVFAVASIGQLIVGHYLDRLGPRTVFMTAAAIQVAFFAIMPGLVDWAALLCAMVFMLAAFGQIPINDYMIGRLAEGEYRARIYGVRYVVSFTVLAASLPLIAFVYEHLGLRRPVPGAGRLRRRHPRRRHAAAAPPAEPAERRRQRVGRIGAKPAIRHFTQPGAAQC